MVSSAWLQALSTWMSPVQPAPPYLRCSGTNTELSVQLVASSDADAAAAATAAASSGACAPLAAASTSTFISTLLPICTPPSLESWSELPPLMVAGSESPPLVDGFTDGRRTLHDG